MNNKPIEICSDEFTNRHTGAKITMTPWGRINGVPAWLVSDPRLNKYALENYKIGYGKGFLAGTAVTLLFATVCALAYKLAADKDKKEKKEEK